MSHDFYRAFEEKLRGSRAVVKERLRTYLPFLQPLAQIAPAAAATDLGCGRGEWLELLRELGLRGHGVDLDDAMLEGCRAAGLSAERADAIGFLRALPDSSQSLVSAFHLVEHLPFEQVQVLVQESLRALVPGGLLVMETPNPENIVVATSGFYLDPTHQRPLPPQLLSFLPEYHGFARVKTVRLQEPPAVHETASLSLYDVLGSASPDYAVVAQKQGSPEQMAALDPAFAAEFGISMATLAQRYESARREELAIVEDHANRLAEQARGLERMINSRRPGHPGAVTRLAGEVQALRDQLAYAEARLAAATSLVAGVTEKLLAQRSKRREQDESLAEPRESPLAASDAPPTAIAPASSVPVTGAPAKVASPSLFRRVTYALVEGHPAIRRGAAKLARVLGLHGPMQRLYRRLTGRPTDTVPAGANGGAAELLPFTPHAEEIYEALKAATTSDRRPS